VAEMNPDPVEALDIRVRVQFRLDVAIHPLAGHLAASVPAVDIEQCLQ
jgi:hypothetical protein